MRYRLLGPVEATADDGRPLRVAAPRRRAILAYLLLHAGQAVASSELIEAMWGEEPPPAARESLQAHISRLRRELPAGAIVTWAPGYQVAVAAGELDVAVAEDLIARARRAVRRGDWTTARDDFGAALNEWRGPALSGLGGEPFAGPHAHRLDDLRLGVLEERIEIDLRLGRHAEVVDELEMLVACHPLREGLCRLLILALYRSRRQADALAAYHTLRNLLRDELGIDPSPELQALEGQMLRQDPILDAVQPVASDERRVRLPRALTALVGRDEDVAEIAALLGSHRLVTLVGPGGVGKTRLAVEAATRAVATYADGTLFVDLAPVRNEQLVLGTIGRETGGGDRPADVIADRRMLLVLDNFEQIVSAGPLVSQLLRQCPGLQALVTSRVPLRVEGEQLFDVEPLAPPDAAALFVQRARESLRRWEPTAAVTDVVMRLDHLPLAIEIAAAQVRVFPGDLLVQLTGPAAQHHGGRRDAPTRHRTLRDTIAWSYELLPDATQTAFRRLSVFAGGFDADAAADVAGAGREQLGQLMETSLLRRDDSRFAMLETLREFAADEAERHGETAALRERHAVHFVEMMPLGADGSPGGAPWMEVCAREGDNLRRAFDHALAAGDLPSVRTLVRGVGVYWLMVGALDEGERWAQALVDLAGPDDVQERGRSLLLLAEYPRWSGDHPRAVALRREAVALARAAGDEERLATLLDDMSSSLAAMGQVDEALAAVDEALAICRRTTNDPQGLAHSLSAKAEVHLRCRDANAALELLEEIRRVEGSFNLPVGWAVQTDEIEARALLLAGRSAEAGKQYRCVARDAAALDVRIVFVNALAGLAAALVEADPTAAARTLGMAERARAETRISFWDPAELESVSTRAEAAIGVRAFEEAHRAGQAMDLEAIRAEVN